jgi:hypothetical protein
VAQAIYFFVACLVFTWMASFNFKRAVEYGEGWEYTAYLLGGLFCTGFAAGYGVNFAIAVFERGIEWTR